MPVEPQRELELAGRERQRERTRTHGAELDRAELTPLERTERLADLRGALDDGCSAGEAPVEAERRGLAARPVQGANPPALQAELQQLVERRRVLLADLALGRRADKVGQPRAVALVRGHREDGLRRDQWATRTDIRKIEIDHDHGAIVKLNPLAEWSEEEVWEYVRERGVPYHPLYDRGYTSIGCAPCTRAIKPGEAARDGRWWWEENAPKECGIHCAIETGGLEHELRALIGEDDE